MTITTTDGGSKATDNSAWKENLEPISKIVGAVLALTYVSGYLVATTFLSRFGIPADASDLLRAKYIYIGFLYWMFVAIVILGGRGVAALHSAIRVCEPISDLEKEAAKNLIEEGTLDAGGGNARMRRLRRWIVVALVLVPFALQIVFLDPNGFRAYSSLQSILLLSIILYQTTFYRQYSTAGYVWGLIYGRWYVERIKDLCVLCPGIIAALLMMGRAVGPWVFSQHSSNLANSLLRFVRLLYLAAFWIRSSSAFWILGAALILFFYCVSLFVTLSSENLRWLQENGKAQRSANGRLRWIWKFLQDYLILIDHAAGVFWQGHPTENKRSFKSDWPSILDCIFFPPIIAIYTYCCLKVLRDEGSEFIARGLSYGTLILALLVLANIAMILTMRLDLIAMLAPDYKPAGDHVNLLARSDVWMVRVLLVGVLYIVSVLGFAYRIYPFVPTQKAGGDFSTAEPVDITLASDSGCSSPGLEEIFSTSAGLIVLSEDSNWIYLAPKSGPGSGGGPACWRWGPYCSSSTDKTSQNAEDASRPTVYSVSRHCVSNMVTAKAK